MQCQCRCPRTSIAAYASPYAVPHALAPAPPSTVGRLVRFESDSDWSETSSVSSDASSLSYASSTESFVGDFAELDLADTAVIAAASKKASSYRKAVQGLRKTNETQSRLKSIGKQKKQPTIGGARIGIDLYGPYSDYDFARLEPSETGGPARMGVRQTNKPIPLVQGIGDFFTKGIPGAVKSIEDGTRDTINGWQQDIKRKQIEFRMDHSAGIQGVGNFLGKQPAAVARRMRR